MYLFTLYIMLIYFLGLAEIDRVFYINNYACAQVRL